MRNFRTVFSSSGAGVSPVRPLELSLKNLKTWGPHPRPKDMTITFLFEDLISNRAENVSHTHVQRTVMVLECTVMATIITLPSIGLFTSVQD